MRASVQYNDFVGTAAADISDHTDLEQFLKSRNINTKRYEAVGAGLYSNYEDSFSGYIICKDNEKSTEDKPHIIRLGFEDEVDKDEFFSLFKRFEVLVTLKHGGYENFSITEELTCPDISNDDEG